MSMAKYLDDNMQATMTKSVRPAPATKGLPLGSVLRLAGVLEQMERDTWSIDRSCDGKSSMLVILSRPVETLKALGHFREHPGKNIADLDDEMRLNMSDYCKWGVLSDLCLLSMRGVLQMSTVEEKDNGPWRSTTFMMADYSDLYLVPNGYGPAAREILELLRES